MTFEMMFVLATVMMVVGGLWLYEFIRVSGDERQYHRWVRDREEVLAKLKASKQGEDEQE